MLRRVVVLGLLAALSPAVSLYTGTLQAASAEECSLPEQVLTRADLPEGVSVVACGAVGRRLNLGKGIGVTVPAPGHSVTVTALGVEEEDSMVMSVEVAADGKISFDSAAYALTSTATDSSPATCDDSTYGLLGHKWYSTMLWRLNDAVKPTNLSATQVQQAVRDGGVNITGASNDCGEVDDISATLSYQGTTTAGVDMFTSNGIVYCDISSQTNKLSTVGFAAMPSGYLAATCTWKINRDPEFDEATESDLRLNLSKSWTVNPDATGCAGQYDLEYVVTHERGHTFGLADLSGDHTGLTMYSRGNSCSGSGRTLGLGDVLGLRQLY
jgi:hypothetical protein